MESYDLYVEKVGAFVAAMRASDRRMREFDVALEPERLLEGLPIRVGPAAHSGLILRKDTFAELGNPDAGSCAFLLWTRDTSLIRNGRLTLIGPDVPESEGASLPFAQVVMVGGKELGSEDQSALEQQQFVSNQVEGYMIRSAPGRVWSRVSRCTAAKGFDLPTLGKALMAIFRSEVPRVEAIEVVFVTSTREDVQQLEEMAPAVRALGKRFVNETWRAKGFDPEACSVSHSCRSCVEKATCDDIRDVAKFRRDAAE